MPVSHTSETVTNMADYRWTLVSGLRELAIVHSVGIRG